MRQLKKNFLRKTRFRFLVLFPPKKNTSFASFAKDELNKISTYYRERGDAHRKLFAPLFHEKAGAFFQESLLVTINPSTLLPEICELYCLETGTLVLPRPALT